MRRVIKATMAMILKNKATLIVVGAILAAGSKETFASKQARGYGHVFEKGNLISNWSFESVGQTWDPNAKAAGFTVDPRFKMSSLGGTNKAVSGSFAGKITGTATASNSTGNFSFYTPYLPIRSTIYYYTVVARRDFTRRPSQNRT